MNIGTQRLRFSILLFLNLVFQAQAKAEGVSYLSLTRFDQVSFNSNFVESKATYLGRNESGGYKYILNRCFGGTSIQVLQDSSNYSFESRTMEFGSTSTVFSSSEYQEPESFGKTICNGYVSSSNSSIAKKIEGRKYLQVEYRDEPSNPYRQKICFYRNISLSVISSPTSDGTISQVDEMQEIVACPQSDR